MGKDKEKAGKGLFFAILGSILFYGFSSIAGRYLALSHTVTIALVITLLLILVSSGILSKSDF